eukprot:SM000112S23977  [mRNA]  locus=s112:161740:168845:+ [translate_table: standard]
MLPRDAHAVLGLEHGASKQQVKDAFRRLAMRSHPDLATSAHKSQAEASFRKISEAYKLLMSAPVQHRAAADMDHIRRGSRLHYGLSSLPFVFLIGGTVCLGGYHLVTGARAVERELSPICVSYGSWSSPPVALQPAPPLARASPRKKKPARAQSAQEVSRPHGEGACALQGGGACSAQAWRGGLVVVSGTGARAAAGRQPERLWSLQLDEQRAEAAWRPRLELHRTPASGCRTEPPCPARRCASCGGCCADAIVADPAPAGSHWRGSEGTISTAREYICLAHGWRRTRGNRQRMASAQTSVQEEPRRAPGLEDSLQVYQRMLSKGAGVQSLLDRLSETVLVLAGTNKLRADREPQPGELALASEAYGMMAATLEMVRPKDVVTKKAAHEAMVHLGYRSMTSKKRRTAPPTPAPSPAASQVAWNPEGKALLRPHQEMYSANSSATYAQPPLSHHGPTMSRPTSSSAIPLLGALEGGSLSTTQLMELLTRRSAESQHQKQLQMEQAANHHLQVNKQEGQSLHWTPESDALMVCEVCKKLDSKATELLLCDACEKGHHLDCVQVSRATLPQGDWYCPPCRAQKSIRPSKYGPIRAASLPATSRQGPGTSAAEESQLVLPAAGALRSAITPSGQQSRAPTAARTAQQELLAQVARASGAWVFSQCQLNDHVKQQGPAPGDAEKVAQPTPTEESQQVQSGALLAQQSQTFSSAESSLAVKADAGPVEKAIALSKEPVVANNEQEQLPAVASGKVPVVGESSNQVQDAQAGGEAGAPENSGKVRESEPTEELAHDIEWENSSPQLHERRLQYSGCRIRGVSYKEMYEDTADKMKVVIVCWCFYPSDLPEAVVKPTSMLEANEVYESNHSDVNPLESIQGPCLVLSPRQAMEELKKREHLKEEDVRPLPPIFVCRWLYNAPEGTFTAAPDAGPPDAGPSVELQQV